MPAQRKYDEETCVRAGRMYRDRLETDGESNPAARYAVGELLGVFRTGGARPPPQVIVDYFATYRDRFGVAPICRVLSAHGITIAPSTFYALSAAPVSQTALEDAYAANALVDLHRANRGVYGVRKVWVAARRAGIDVGRDQVARLMGIAGLVGTVRGHHVPTTTKRAVQTPRHPDLIERA